MNHDAHFWLSISFSVGLGLLIWKLNLVSLTVYSVPMYLTANLPDIFEPALSPNHRRFFHSKKFFKFLCVCLVIALFYATFKTPTAYFYFFGVVGYLLHLCSDSLSWKGLPN